MTTRLKVLIGTLLAIAAIGGAGNWLVQSGLVEKWSRRTPWIPKSNETVEVEVTDYTPPPPDPLDALLTDDRLEDKPADFDPKRVHPVVESGWKVNLSDAVIRLDVPMIRPDVEPHLTGLYPSYADALKAIGPNANVLPSVNMIDGKAKQFDDGLYAAIDLAYYQGLAGKLQGHIDLIKMMADRLGPDSPGTAFLAGGLELAGIKIPVSDEKAKQLHINKFKINPIAGKPIGFYTWNARLTELFIVLRYFQQPQPADVAWSISGFLQDDAKLRDEYTRAAHLFAGLTNPFKNLSNADLAKLPRGTPPPDGKTVSLFPASTSKETELFDKVFERGLPPDADLMRELITAIRSGKVDLAPRKDAGWYEYQVYALETMLLPEKGPENARLLLTKSYKKRMLEAFKAMVTKRRETHARQMGMGAPTAAVRPPSRLKPRLRVEPNPTYYLRTARSYAFLSNLLDSTLGPDVLKSIKGLTQRGERPSSLDEELAGMSRLFYGLYLLSAEDIGLKVALKDGELDAESRDAAKSAAMEWIKACKTDPDLAVDTRVSIPVMIDPKRNVTRLWATLGVRWAKLDAGYARGPQVQPEKDNTPWKRAEPRTLEHESYLIAVDEFAEIELQGLRALSREEFRNILNEHKTKESALKAFH